MTTRRFGITEDGQLLLVDDQGELPPTVHAVEGFAFTTAPAVHDYWYSYTVAEGIDGKYESDGKWRLVAYTDAERFRNHQTLRYHSALCPVVEADSVDHKNQGFPPIEELVP
jgi:hypothetical protein